MSAPGDRDPRIDALYDRTRAPQPSAEADAALRAAARRAVASRPESEHSARRRRPGWMPSLALAATVVLGVGIAWRIERAPQTPPVPAPAAERAALPNPAPSAPASTPDAAAEAPAAATADVRARKPLESARPATPARSAPSAQVPTAAKRAMPTAAETFADHAGSRAALPNPASSTPAPSAPAEPTATLQEAAPLAAEPARREAATMSAPSAARDATQDSALTPEERLQRIRALKKAGRAAEAQAALERFMRRYPEYPLPEDLRPPTP